MTKHERAAEMSHVRTRDPVRHSGFGLLSSFVIRASSLVLPVLLVAGVTLAQQSFTVTAAKVNPKLVKLFGAGGFKGLPSYGTGILISPKGHILTVNNHILSTADLRAHLYDGRFHH